MCDLPAAIITVLRHFELAFSERVGMGEDLARRGSFGTRQTHRHQCTVCNGLEPGTPISDLSSRAQS
jgi:hypothetical protein